jgi:glycosyltransferase involved in cell wall biosynthesis
MMCVLHVYAGNLYGGVETFLSTLARERAASAAAGIEHHFVLCFEGRLSQELAAAGAPVELLGPVRLSRPWTLAAARRNLRSLLARERFDIAVCHSAWPHAAFAPVVRAAVVPLVFWAHGAAGDHLLDRWAARAAPDLLVANSAYTLMTYGEWFPGVPREVVRCAVRPPSVADRASARRAVRRETGTSDDDVVIACTSRLEPSKGHAVLLDALARIADVPRWTGWIAGAPQRSGETPYLDRLRSAAAAHGLTGRVKFIGQRADVADVLCAADVYCQPNVSPEAFGIAYVEAMYAGLPVVTSGIGGALEVVSSDCGALLPPNDSEALAAALRGLICDGDLRRELGARGPRRAAELCDPARVLQRMRDVLQPVSAGFAPGRKAS